MYRKQLSSVINQIIQTENSYMVQPEIIDAYKQLNDKCDKIISKIKNRKIIQADK
jgi:hypothetical protein